MDNNTRIVFVTTPDNPSGYCPPRAAVEALASELGAKAPDCLLVVDEAYVDFADDEKAASMLAGGILPGNTAFMLTFSKSFGLAGMRVGCGILRPSGRLSLAGTAAFFCQHSGEEAALAALDDHTFYDAAPADRAHWPQRAFRRSEGSGLHGLAQSGKLFDVRHAGRPQCGAVFETLLARGIIIRPLKSYSLQTCCA